jgi:hypothetical protein
MTLVFGVVFIALGLAVFKVPDYYVEDRWLKWWTAVPAIALGLLIGWPRCWGSSDVRARLRAQRR